MEYMRRDKELKEWLRYRTIYLKAQGRQFFVPQLLGHIIADTDDFKEIKSRLKIWEYQCNEKCTDDIFVEIMTEVAYIERKIDELSYNKQFMEKRMSAD